MEARGLVRCGHDDLGHDHHSLGTVGEKCIHLICEFIRAFGTSDFASLQGNSMVYDCVPTLSRLSRTCRSMYVAVRNLPSVVTLFEPSISKYPLPRGEAALDVAYWSDLAGIVWYVKDAAQLHELASICAACDAAGNDSTHADHERMRGGAQQLRKLFISIDWSSVDQRQGVDAKGPLWKAAQPVIRHVGGLSLYLDGNLDKQFAEVPRLAADATTTSASSLRFFSLTYHLGRAGSTRSCVPVMRKFATDVEAIEFKSVLLIREGASQPLLDMRPFSKFEHVIVCAANSFSSLGALQPSARLIDISFDQSSTNTLPALAPLGNTHTVAIKRNPQIADVSVLGGVHTLTLDGCDGVTDVSALGGVHTLVLSSLATIKNVNPLSNLHELQLTKCPELTDVRALGRLHTVTLTACPSLTDVSTLGSVHTLMLYRCASISDVSALGGVYEVHISFCDAITDVSALGTVHNLSLTSTVVTDVSCLRNVHELYLLVYQLGTDVSALGGVHTLSLNGGSRVSDVSALGNVHALSLSSMDLLTDVSALGGVHTLILADMPSLTDVSALGSVHDLAIIDCNHLTDVGALGSVHSLKLSYCSAISDVNALGSTKRLSLRNCPRISDVSGLGGVHELEIRSCGEVTNVSALHGVHTLTLGGNLADPAVGTLYGVHRLFLEDCLSAEATASLVGKVPIVVDF